ncbi:serine hydrolase [Dyadobacter fanqingshengii]|uniref:Class A beta-lactamase-related serine hydrolase n=1 Tax=Dyadobacter fanqingshengii TaxID=2906443 RepID=A0A9X1P7F7_9BACT|nr:serine hydrolase [Dyadobacter fanqingshengii]MCF0039362.1 class A beta-lactamase-related serine hydrolase [Dyadobacter fanqingshengii]USJ33823.1 class A beta-lactamase-related serine hydrolase [Dyadobacter fanqingshengii]
MRNCLLSLLLFSVSFVKAQPSAVGKTSMDHKLVKKLEEAMAGFKGEAGIYVRNLKTNRIAEVHADSIFPTASMVKVPILCGIFDKINRGEVAFNQELVYRDSLKYDNGIVGSFRDSTKIALPKVVHLMISQSDNTGSLWLQAMAGGGATINQWLDSNGFGNIRVNSRTPGRKENQAKYGWGQTTPREMAELVAMIRNGKAINPAVSERMYRYLGMQFWDGESISQVPPNIKIAAKSGAVNQAKSEVLVIHAPHGDYVFCVATKNQQDQAWEKDNEGYVLIRKLSAIIWNHFEPKSDWKPLQESEKFWF